MKTYRLLFPAALLAALCNTVVAQTTMTTNVWLGHFVSRVPGDSSRGYHLVEAVVTRGRCILLDAAYLDFGRGGEYREWFAGAGCNSVVSKSLTVSHELIFAQSSGSKGGGATYLWLWTGIFYNLTPRLGGDIVFFPYLPLDKAGKRQFVIERAKLEYRLHPAIKLGAGYGAYQISGEEWQHKPFITVTLAPFAGKFGSMEFWLQKMPSGAQVQTRYQIMFKEKK
ncbi:MAG TPA: hypothetical protein VJB95_03085 [Candidatus Paceibacterota bacterium]